VVPFFSAEIPIPLITPMQSKGNIDLILYVDSAVGDIDFIDD
jgi:hypothetical protein